MEDEHSFSSAIDLSLEVEVIQTWTYVGGSRGPSILLVRRRWPLFWPVTKASEWMMRRRDKVDRVPSARPSVISTLRRRFGLTMPRVVSMSATAGNGGHSKRPMSSVPATTTHRCT